jgi:hypothetical protein
MTDPTVDELLAEVRRLRSRVEELDRTLHERVAPVEPGAPAETVVPGGPTSRRRMLALAGGGAAAAVAAVVTPSTPAAATNGEPLSIATAVSSSSGNVVSTFLNYTTATTNSNIRNLFVVGDEGDALSPPATDVAAISGSTSTTLLKVGVLGTAADAGNVAGVVGRATSTSAGVKGIATSGPGVLAESASGLDINLNGTGRLLLKSSASVGGPAAGTHAVGEVTRDGQANYWVCIAAGTPGTWRRLGGGSSVGALQLLSQPKRCYDSRAAQPPAGGGTKGILAAHAQRVIDSKNNGTTVLPGATAVMINITIRSASAAGLISAYSAGLATWPGTTTLAWSRNAESSSNLAVVGVDSQAKFKVYASARTNFWVDVLGYYI